MSKSVKVLYRVDYGDKTIHLTEKEALDIYEQLAFLFQDRAKPVSETPVPTASPYGYYWFPMDFIGNDRRQ